MNYTLFIHKFHNYLEQHPVLMWLIIALILIVGLIQFEKMGEAIGKCIYYLKH